MCTLLTEFTSRMESGESIGDLLQENASLHTPRGEVRGRTEIAKLFLTLFESRQRSGQVARHSSLDVRARELSDNRFEVGSLLIAFSLSGVETEGGSLLIGDQIDIVELDFDGVYRFAARKLTPALEFSLSRKPQVGH
jgi:hypothetical protein